MPWIRSYARSGGTPVRGRTRWAPGARREVTILGGVASAGVAPGDGDASGAGEGVPRPRPTVSCPIRWER